MFLIMNLELIKQKNLEIAASKGFGIAPDQLVVAEKIALIHSEISEAYDAHQKQNLTGKDGFYEELADVLLRTLHLAGAYGVVFPAEFSAPEPAASIDAQIAGLHKLASIAYEHYRQHREEEFKLALADIAFAVVGLSHAYQFDLAAEAEKKMEYNKTRTWKTNETRNS